MRGAKEVHFRLASPPITASRFPTGFGTRPSADNLLAATHDLGAMRAYIWRRFAGLPLGRGIVSRARLPRSRSALRPVDAITAHRPIYPTPLSDSRSRQARQCSPCSQKPIWSLMTKDVFRTVIARVTVGLARISAGAAAARASPRPGAIVVAVARNAGCAGRKLDE